MLGRRLIAAFAILAILFSLIGLELWLGETFRPGIVFSPVVILIALAGADELRQMLGGRDETLRRSIVACGILMQLGIAAAPVLWNPYPEDCPVGKAGWLLFGTAAAIGVAFAHELWVYRPDANGPDFLGRLANTVLVFGYVGLLFGFLFPLRYLGGNFLGLFAVLSIPAVVKMCDTFAYFTGRAIGRTQATRHLSPGKTMEGFAGGVFGGIVGAVIWFMWVGPHVLDETVRFNWVPVVVFGITVSIAGIIGDLSESFLKRVCKTKDSSGWMPGLGGVLDVIDSVLIAVPVAYALWVSGMLV